MGKYTSLQDDIFSIFASSLWKSEGINTVPSLIVPKNTGQEYIRVSIIPGDFGIDHRSVSGILMIDIFAEKVKSQKRVPEIADILDKHLSAKTKQTSSGGSTQLMSSSLGQTFEDKDNPSMSKTSYSIAFNYFGVQ